MGGRLLSGLAPDVAGFELDGRFLVAVPARNQLLILNQSGRCLFEALLEGATPDALPRILVRHYGIDARRAARDVAATLAAWRSAGALADEGRPPPLPSAPPPPDRAARFAQAYTFDGRAIRIEVDDTSLAAALHPLLAPLEAPALDDPPTESGVIRAVEAPDGGFVVHLGGGRFRRAADPDLALGEIINALIDRMHPGARWLAIIHASAVVAEGGALVMTAPSGSGKSTLCAALTAGGHRYMSDDVVPIAADGMAYPVPLAQSLKRGSWRVLGEWLPGLPDVDAAPPGPGVEHHRAVGSALTARGPARVAAFLVPRYVPGAALEHRALEPFSTLTRLIQARSWVSLERADLEHLLALIRKTASFELIYGSLDDAVSFLGRLKIE